MTCTLAIVIHFSEVRAFYTHYFYTSIVCILYVANPTDVLKVQPLSMKRGAGLYRVCVCSKQ